MRVDVGWERSEPNSLRCIINYLLPMSGLCATHMKTKRWNRLKRFRLTETIYMNLNASLISAFLKNCFEALAKKQVNVVHFKHINKINIIQGIS
jgi:hypothetical protein